MNETEQEKSSSRVNQTVEEWCKCGKCEPMLTEKECRCCHKAASHYLNGNIRGGSTNFCHKRAIVTKGSMLDVRVFEFQPS